MSFPVTRNATSVNESITFAQYPGGLYRYRRGLGMFPSFEYSAYFNDFNTLVASNVVTGATTIKDTNGTLTNLATGSDTSGVIRITGSAGSDGVSNYFPKSITLGGARFFMEVRARASTVNDADIMFGLTSVTASTNPEDLYTTAADSLLAFGIQDATTVAGAPFLIYDKANAGPQTDSTTSAYLTANSTWYTLGLYYNGASSASTGGFVAGYVNGVQVITATVLSKVPDNVLLAPFFAGRCGNGGVSTIDYDYIRWSIDRI